MFDQYVISILRRRCGPLRQMSHVSWSACLCVGHTGKPCKTTEPIEMPFGGLTHESPSKHVLEGSRSDESIRLRGEWQDGDAAFRQNSLTTCFSKFCTCLAVMYCPKLTSPDNGSLSTRDVVYNTVVTVTCNTGFKMFDDQRQKTLICLDDNGAVWNDTITHCQRTNKSLSTMIQYCTVDVIICVLC